VDLCAACAQAIFERGKRGALIGGCPIIDDPSERTSNRDQRYERHGGGDGTTNGGRRNVSQGS
jgi:hypothetical protein